MNNEQSALRNECLFEVYLHLQGYANGYLRKAKRAQDNGDTDMYLYYRDKSICYADIWHEFTEKYF